jgi:asparagine synthase (glutamine-hydrolysing)
MTGYRYLAIFAEDPQRITEIETDRLTALGLSVGCRTRHSLIATERGDVLVPLANGEGTIVGQVFDRKVGHERLTKIPIGISHAIVDTRGRFAVSRLWGPHVLVIDNVHRSELTLARDPSASIPCYALRRDGLTFVGSSVRELARITGARLTPSADLLASYLKEPDIPSHLTPLDGVFELMPGFQVDPRASWAEQQPYWSPWDHVGAEDPEEDQPDPSALEDAISTSVRALCSSFDQVIVSLSGGLDSSLVASFLQDHPRRIAFNLAGDDPDSDEREFARLAAKAAGIELALGRYGAEAIDLTKATLGHLPRPVGRPHMQIFQSMLGALGNGNCSAAHLTGLGGDSVFCATRSSLALVDAVRSRRPGAEYAGITKDLRAITQCGTVPIVRQAVTTLALGRRPKRISEFEAFLSRACRDDHHLSAVTHKWLTPPRDVLPGRAYHVELITRLLPYVNDYAEEGLPTLVAPLLSQPVLEACLRTPTWHWIRGGHDRAVARTVAATRLPREIAYRRSKSGPDSLAVALCLTQGRVIEDALSDGILARAGLISTRGIRRALMETNVLRYGKCSTILALLEIENWAGKWSASAGAHDIASLIKA